jgi:hypothetical protein
MSIADAMRVIALENRVVDLAERSREPWQGESRMKRSLVTKVQSPKIL